MYHLQETGRLGHFLKAMRQRDPVEDASGVTALCIAAGEPLEALEDSAWKRASKLQDP